MNPLQQVERCPRTARLSARERDASRLYQELLRSAGSQAAGRIGRSYDRLCATLIAALCDADARSIHAHKETE
jgi:hypothetical protein